MTSIVLLAGSDADAGTAATLANERSLLQSIIEDSSDEVEVNLVSFGPAVAFHGVAARVNIDPTSEGVVDSILRALGAFALRRKFATFPLGRLFNSMGPVDPGRVFWRAVRRNQRAWKLINRADIAIAVDLAAAKTAWVAVRRDIVKDAHFDPPSALFGETIAEEAPQRP